MLFPEAQKIHFMHCSSTQVINIFFSKLNPMRAQQVENLGVKAGGTCSFPRSQISWTRDKYFWRALCDPRDESIQFVNQNIEENNIV